MKGGVASRRFCSPKFLVALAIFRYINPAFCRRKDKRCSTCFSGPREGWRMANYHPFLPLKILLPTSLCNVSRYSWLARAVFCDSRCRSKGAINTGHYYTFLLCASLLQFSMHMQTVCVGHEVGDNNAVLIPISCSHLSRFWTWNLRQALCHSHFT